MTILNKLFILPYLLLERQRWFQFFKSISTTFISWTWTLMYRYSLSLQTHTYTYFHYILTHVHTFITYTYFHYILTHVHTFLTYSHMYILTRPCETRSSPKFPRTIPSDSSSLLQTTPPAPPPGRLPPRQSADACSCECTARGTASGGQRSHSPATTP